MCSEPAFIPRAVLLSIAALVCSPAALAQAAAPIFINELHYDNAGADAGEAVEIAGPAGTDIFNLTLVPYNGSTGASYTPAGALSGTIPNLQAGFGTVSVNIVGLQNGAPDGIALVRGGTEVLQFLCYEGTFTATNGPAAGRTCTDIGQQELGTEALGGSLQLAGSGSQYADFTWQAVAANTFGQVNRGQTFVSAAVDEAPAVASITPLPNASAVPVTASIVVVFTEPVSTSAAAFGLSCAGLAQPFTFSGSGSSYTLDPDADLPPMQNCTVTISAGGVMDQDAPVQTMAADFSASFTTGASMACGAPATFISAVQGSGAMSPLANQMVQVEGVVVGDFQGTTGLNGFFVQEETVDQDS
ncbi:MAG: Ig-like domain-containing protein, partial [Pseudomonadota bacterium]